MSILLLLQALLLPFFFQHTQTKAAALATSSAVVQPQQNLTFDTALLSEPQLTGSQIYWPIISTPYILTFTKYASGRDERDFYAAIISAQTAIFEAYLLSPSPRIQEDEVDYNFYGVNIEINNYDLDLTYAVTSKVLGEVGAFLQKWKKCETSWTLLEKLEGRDTGNVVTVGQIRRKALVSLAAE